MNGEPEIPNPVPEIARGPLWRTLLIPPLLTLIPNFALGIIGNDLMAWSLLTPFIVFLAILIQLQSFNKIVGVRYQGPSFVFLVFSYFFVQIIVCLKLWFGSCLLFSR